MKTYEVMMRKPYDETRGNSLQNSVFKEHSQSMTIYPYTDMTDYRSKFMASPRLTFFVELYPQRDEKKGFPHHLLNMACKDAHACTIQYKEQSFTA